MSTTDLVTTRAWINQNAQLVDSFVETICAKGTPGLDPEDLVGLREHFLFRGAFNDEVITRALLHPLEKHACAVAFRDRTPAATEESFF
jgi:hypothetical protein